MAKNHTTQRTPTTSSYSWYFLCCGVGVFIAFLMFNDIIMSILFGLPIGYLFGLTIKGSPKRQ